MIGDTNRPPRPAVQLRRVEELMLSVEREKQQLSKALTEKRNIKLEMKQLQADNSRLQSQKNPPLVRELRGSIADLEEGVRRLERELAESRRSEDAQRIRAMNEEKSAKRIQNAASNSEQERMTAVAAAEELVRTAQAAEGEAVRSCAAATSDLERFRRYCEELKATAAKLEEERNLAEVIATSAVNEAAEEAAAAKAEAAAMKKLRDQAQEAVDDGDASDIGFLESLKTVEASTLRAAGKAARELAKAQRVLDAHTANLSLRSISEDEWHTSPVFLYTTKCLSLLSLSI